MDHKLIQLSALDVYYLEDDKTLSLTGWTLTHQWTDKSVDLSPPFCDQSVVQLTLIIIITAHFSNKFPFSFFIAEWQIMDPSLLPDDDQVVGATPSNAFPQSDQQLWCLHNLWRPVWLSNEINETRVVCDCVRSSLKESCEPSAVLLLLMRLLFCVSRVFLFCWSSQRVQLKVHNNFNCNFGAATITPECRKRALIAEPFERKSFYHSVCALTLSLSLSRSVLCGCVLSCNSTSSHFWRVLSKVRLPLLLTRR